MERNKLFAIKPSAMTNDEKAQLCAILINWGYTVRLTEGHDEQRHEADCG